MTLTSPVSVPRPTQSEKARAFHAMHGEGVLVLPNAWDVASAVLVRDAGARAVATTSAGASWSLGTPDGEQLARERAVDLVVRIVTLVDEPITVDIETGYGVDAAEVAATARAVLSAGAVGVNLEDGDGAPLRPVSEQAERIIAIREAADDAGVALFINARTDTYLMEVGDPADRLAETIHRAHAYLAAGADGIFVPGLMRAETIRELTTAVSAPINIMVGPGALTVPELTGLGVRRVSTGMAIAQAVYAHTRRAAAEVLTDGTYAELTDGLDYGTLNAALSTR